MTAPLLSVIIPTHNRPQFLPRAVQSALDAAPNGDVEVIVVPNGGDLTWQESLANFSQEKRVIVFPIATPHANAARNHGLKIAQGKYVRFLDDDDYLLPAAVKQCERLEQSDADLCAGEVAVVNEKGKILNKLVVAPVEDLTELTLSAFRRTGIQFFVYKREILDNLWWDEDLSIGQDTSWTHNMVRVKSLKLTVLDHVVCSWVQHSSDQISKGLGKSGHLQLQEKYLWETIQCVENLAGMSEKRTTAAAKGMWSLIHAGFYLNPVFWYRVMRKVQLKFPDTYPDLNIYKGNYKKVIPPIVLELVVSPKRWLNYFYHRLLIIFGKTSAW